MERKESNMQTLETLYEQYASLVLKVCYDYCEDYDIARSMTQEVFLALISEIDNIDINKVGKWLTVTARNKTLNFVKRQKYEVLTDDLAEIMDEKYTSESAEEIAFNVIRNEERSYRENKMLEALYNKNERWYKAITMTYYLGYSQVKVAEKLGMNTNALYVLMGRAKRWIEEYYRKLDEDIL